MPFALLHCTNVYPTPDNLVRLGGCSELAEKFPDAVIGLSDHSIDNLACLGAVALGASVLERHFTDHKGRAGPDICCSMDLDECKNLILGSQRLWRMRGGTKGALPEEKATIDFAYASVVSIKKIQRGERLSKENIWVKRPGTGYFLAEDFDTLLGQIAMRDIPEDEHLSYADVEKP